MTIFMHKPFRIHRWQKLALAFGLLCLEGIIIFNMKELIRTFSFYFLCDRLFCQCLPAIVLFEKL